MPTYRHVAIAMSSLSPASWVREEDRRPRGPQPSSRSLPRQAAAREPAVARAQRDPSGEDPRTHGATQRRLYELLPAAIIGQAVEGAAESQAHRAPAGRPARAQGHDSQALSARAGGSPGPGRGRALREVPSSPPPRGCHGRSAAPPRRRDPADRSRGHRVRAQRGLLPELRRGHDSGPARGCARRLCRSAFPGHPRAPHGTLPDQSPRGRRRLRGALRREGEDLGGDGRGAGSHRCGSS